MSKRRTTAAAEAAPQKEAGKRLPISLTVEEAVKAHEELGKAANKAMNAVLAFRLATMQRKLSGTVKDFEAARQGLFERMGQKVGDQYKIAPDQVAAFTEEIQELIAQEQEYDLPRITLADFDRLELSPAFFIALEKVITE